MIDYGLIKGKVVDMGRHENTAGSGNPHFHIIIDGAGRWRCPVNIRSQDQSEVWFKIEQPVNEVRLLTNLRELPVGLKKLDQPADRRSGLTLDYVREPLFDRKHMVHLPFNRSGEQDDIQDHIEMLARRAQRENGAETYVFGEYWLNRVFEGDRPFGTNQGVHEVHMNQGNDARFASSDGVFQDGGVLFHFPSTGWTGLFLAFNSQCWFTNDQTGHRLPGEAEGPLAEKRQGEDPQRPQVTGAVGIIAALINPPAADPGFETVSLFNFSPTTIVLSGWRIIDRNGKAETLGQLTLPSNQALTLTLSGQGAQLGNNGGSIRLVDAAGATVDSVTYSAADAVSGRIFRF